MRDDGNPHAGVFVRGKPGHSGVDHRLLVLPFPTTSAEQNSELLLGWGTVGSCCTLLSYVPATDAAVVAVAPVFAPQPDDISYLPGRLYFLHLGQERRFIYRYADNSLPVLSKTLGKSFVDEPDAISVAIPRLQQGGEVRGGPLSEPSPIFDNGIARFYPATLKGANAERLEIRYSVPLTSYQETLLKALVQLVAAILPPILALFFLEVKDPKKVRVQKLALWVSTVVEIAILATIGWFAYDAWDTESFEAVAGAVVALVGGIFSAAVLYTKRGTLQAS